MARFRKKPVIVDAVRLKHRVVLLSQRGFAGDWLVTDVSGARFVYEDDLFQATHEPVNAEARLMMEV